MIKSCAVFIGQTSCKLIGSNFSIICEAGNNGTIITKLRTDLLKCYLFEMTAGIKHVMEFSSEH